MYVAVSAPFASGSRAPTPTPAVRIGCTPTPRAFLTRAPRRRRGSARLSSPRPRLSLQCRQSPPPLHRRLPPLPPRTACTRAAQGTPARSSSSAARAAGAGRACVWGGGGRGRGDKGEGGISFLPILYRMRNAPPPPCRLWHGVADPSKTATQSPVHWCNGEGGALRAPPKHTHTHTQMCTRSPTAPPPLPHVAPSRGGRVNEWGGVREAKGAPRACREGLVGGGCGTVCPGADPRLPDAPACVPTSPPPSSPSSHADLHPF